MWKDNPYSYWMRGDFLKAWADKNELRVTQDKPVFAWADIETTGLDNRKDVMLNMGIVLTNEVGDVCENGAIDWLMWNFTATHKKAFDDMLPFVRDMHMKSGLLKAIAEIREAGGIKFNQRTHEAHLERVTQVQTHVSTQTVSLQSRAWLQSMCGEGVSLQLSGSTPHFDRGFLQTYMKDLESWFHYRSGVDVSGIREIAKRVNPSVIESQPIKAEIHRPLPDLADSIRLYRHLLNTFMVPDMPSQTKLVGL